MFNRRVVFCRTFPMEVSREKFLVQLLYCNASVNVDLSAESGPDSESRRELVSNVIYIT